MLNLSSGSPVAPPETERTAPVVITEQQVLLSTSVVLSRSTGWRQRAVIAAIRRIFTPSPNAGGRLPPHDFIADARMEREMHRL